jgi:AMP nucleosidase
LVDRGLEYRTVVMYTTNRRVWEHDVKFREQLQEYTPIAIDMETATIIVVGHKNQIARGALLLVSDKPDDQALPVLRLC